MTTLAHGLLLLSFVSSVLDEGPAAEIRYNGTLTPTGRNSEGFSTKQFDVYCLLVNRKEGRTLSYLVDEAGGGAWPWPERFGIQSLDESHRVTNKTNIRLLHDHDGTLNPVNVRSPMFEFGNKLAAAAMWVDGKQSYEVLRSWKIGDRECWEVNVSNNFGLQETLHIEKESHLVVSAEQRVFMGRGDRYTLKLSLESAKPLDAAALAKLRPPLETISQLKESLKRSQSEETKPLLSDEQLKAAADVIERLTSEAEKTPFERYATIIRRDVASQQQRVTDVAGLAEKYVGTKAPPIALSKLAGGKVAAEDYAGKIVVLHFWEYRNKPLEEPYGQVGYLDFLTNRNRKRKLDVVTYGVAVDKGLADPAQRTAVVRSAKQLQEFFNLSYPILLDDGTLLAKFGDPRRLDAKLPLWVIVGADGKIAHYSTGFFNIKPDDGLKQLEEVIVDLVKRQRDASE